ncbi:MAG: hypothetical protein HYS18_07320 [Burkholderiales bacterium]|nr:hypothetical protein [Burkholderiales bacterium]
MLTSKLLKAAAITVGFCALAIGTDPGFAQQMRNDMRSDPPNQGPRRAGIPPRPDLASALGADAKTAQAVEQVMRDHREKMEDLRKQTDMKLSKLLTEEQLRKLHQMHSRRPHQDNQVQGEPTPRRY